MCTLERAASITRGLEAGYRRSERVGEMLRVRRRPGRLLGHIFRRFLGARGPRAGRCRGARPGCRNARGSGRRRHPAPWRWARRRPHRSLANRSSWSAACRWLTPTPNKRTRARGCSASQAVSNSAGDLGDGARVGGRGFEALLAREGGEIGAADLHLHAAGGEILRAHARAGAIGEPQHLGVHAFVVAAGRWRRSLRR